MDLNGEKLEIAEDINEEAYKQISVESFGKLMIDKMKQSEIFLSKKRKPQKLIEFKIKHSKIGLGYNENESKNFKGKDKKETFSFYGQNVYINKGEFEGLDGKILISHEYESLYQLIKENEYILIELNINGQKHKIKNEYISLTKKEIKNNEDNKDEKEKEIKKQKIKWIVPNIIIRIIDEKSKYYNTKAKVIDIISEDTFTLLTNDNTLHTEFSEDNCETYIPKLNQVVLILKGIHKNKKGKIIFRDKNKDIVNILLLEDLETVTLTQDDISATS